MGFIQKLGTFGLFLCAFSGDIAHSSEHTTSKFTENNIRYFVEDLTERANEIRDDNSIDNASSFFSKHLHSDAFFKSSITYDIPGYPAQENSITYNKDQYIDSLINTRNMSEDFEANVSVSHIRISKDGTKATMKTVTNERATMLVPQANGTEQVPMNGVSRCNQTLKIGSNKKIQIYSAICKTEMRFQDMY